MTAGLGSFSETITNFDVDTMYATPLPPMFPVTSPLPFVGVEDTEYVAFTATPRLGPFGAPISSVPLRLPVGLTPSAVNSPEKMVTPSAAGVVAEPAYLPVIAASVKDPAACASPKPNKTEPSGT